jgi:hypothetical protein
MTVPVSSRPLWHRCAISWRDSGAGRRWRLGRTGWAIGPDAARARGACPGDVHPGMCGSRWRGGWWECSARWLRWRCWRRSTLGRRSRFAAPSLASLSVMITLGTHWHPFSSLRKNFLAACLSRRRWTKISRTWPPDRPPATGSAARHGWCGRLHRDAMYHQAWGAGAVTDWHRLVRISGTTSGWLRRSRSPRGRTGVLPHRDSWGGTGNRAIRRG